MNLYDIGDKVRCSAAFTDADGNAVDPDVVIFKFRILGGEVTTYTYDEDAEIVRDSAGNYHADVSVGAEGNWMFRFESTGAGQAAGERHFKVSQSEFD